MNLFTNMTTIEKAKILFSGIVGMVISFFMLLVVNVIMVETAINIALATVYHFLSLELRNAV